eukprot:768681-Hanusia_phi.AAC.2
MLGFFDKNKRLHQLCQVSPSSLLPRFHRVVSARQECSGFHPRLLCSPRRVRIGNSPLPPPLGLTLHSQAATGWWSITGGRVKKELTTRQ